MLAAHSNLQFLSPVLVLLWPFRVVFPIPRCQPYKLHEKKVWRWHLLHDLTVLDDALDLLDHQGGDTQYNMSATLLLERAREG